MGNAIVVTGYSRGRYTDANLQLKAEQILNALTDNPAFTEPQPTLATLKSCSEKFSNALTEAASGSKEAIVRKNDVRTELEGVLKHLAGYVQIVSQGDEALILSAGFDVRKKPSPVGILEKPKSLTVRPGKNSGSVELISSIVPNARFYIFEYVEAPIGDGSRWQQVVHTRHNLLLEGLESRKEYAFRVAAGASSTFRVWSDVIYSNVL